MLNEQPFSEEGGRRNYWEIMLPGSLAGAIVGYATQRYGQRPDEARA
jgi:hypothetical protein